MAPPLSRLVVADDLGAMARRLDARTADDIAWVGASGAWFHAEARRRIGADAGGHGAAVWLRWVEAWCAVALLPAAEAAERVPWPLLTDESCEPALRFAGRLAAADEAWRRAFHLAAAGPMTRFPSDGRLVVHRHEEADPVVEEAVSRASLSVYDDSAADRLVPEPDAGEILLHQVGTGRLGQWRWELTQTDVRRVVAEISVDRDLLVAACLAALVSDSRPSHQRVLACLLAELGLSAADLRGGAGQALALVTDRHVSVAAVALPLALDLTAGRDLQQVGAVAATRERRLRTVALRHVERTTFVERASPAAVDAVVRTLLEHEDDAALLARGARLRARLGVGAPAAGAAPPDDDLWDRDPRPAGTQRPPVVPRALPRWATLATRGRHVRAREEDWVVDEVVRAMAAGRFDGDAFATELRAVMVRGQLVLPRVTRLLEVLFSRGGLAQGFVPALVVAESAAEHRTAGLDGLLRLLRHHARPGAARPGRHLVELAGSGSTSKAAQEAVLLVEALAADDAPEPDSTLPPSAVLDPAPGDQHVVARGAPDLVTLAARVADDDETRYRGMDANAADGAWVRPDVLLADVVGAIGRWGPDRVRSALRDLDPSPLDGTWGGLCAGPVGTAVDVWVAGALTTTSYPRLWTAEPEAGHELVPPLWEPRRTGFPRLRLERSLLSDRPLLPRVFTAPAAQVLLLHACESLLLAPGRVAPLSTPTRLDGTLALDDLLDRVDLGPVGPLDLLLALHRLRPWDDGAARRAARLGSGTTTEPSVSGPSPLDVGEMVRRWVDGGGLPPLRSTWSAAQPGPRDPARHDGAPESVWEHRLGDGPVTWAETDVAPAGILGQPGRGHVGATLRIVPRRPDLGVLRTRGAWTRAAEVAGLLTLHGHGPATADLVVGALMGTDHERDELVAAVARRATPERVAPDLLRRATLDHLAAGLISSKRATPVLRALFHAGGQATWWPVALTIAAHDCAADRTPAGLGDLLSLLADTVSAVVDRRLPPEIEALAARPGRSRARTEAVRLVAAAGGS